MNKNRQLFLQNASKLHSWNNVQEYYIVEDIRKLPFTQFLYAFNRNVDFGKVNEIQEFLHQSYEQTKDILTGAWLIILGGTTPNGNFVCLDGQHRWNACFQWATSNGIKVPLLFMVQRFMTEDEMYNSWVSYAGAREVPDTLRRKIGESIGEDGLRKVSLQQRMEQKEFIQFMVENLNITYPQLIQSYKNPTKPNMNITSLEQQITKIYDNLPSEPKKTMPCRPNAQEPQRLLDLIIWLNRELLGWDIHQIIESGFLRQSSIGKMEEMQKIGAIIGYHQFWIRLEEWTKNNSRKWKSLYQQWIVEKKLSH